MRSVLIGFAVLVSLAVSLPAAQKSQPAQGGIASQRIGTAAQPPSLTRDQQLEFQVVALKLENARLRADAAQRDFLDAQREVQALVEKAKVDGYDLDLQSLSYKPSVAPKPEVKK